MVTVHTYKGNSNVPKTKQKSEKKIRYMKTFLFFKPMPLYLRKVLLLLFPIICILTYKTVGSSTLLIGTNFIMRERCNYFIRIKITTSRTESLNKQKFNLSKD